MLQSSEDVSCCLQVEAAPNSAPMLAVARNLRMERDREEQIQKQKQEQRNLVSPSCLAVSLPVLMVSLQLNGFHLSH